MAGFRGARVVFGWFLLMGVACAEPPPDYRISLLTTDSPPVNMAKKGGNVFARGDEIEGYATDIVREMFKRAAIDYDITLRNPWERELEMVRKTANTGIFSIVQTEQRKPRYKWIGPFGTVDQVLVAAPNKNIEIDQLADVAGYRLGAMKADSMVELLEQQGVPYQAAATDYESIKKLVDGKIDLWATNDLTLAWQAKHQGVVGLHVVYRLNHAPAPFYLAVNRDTPDEVVQRLQEALEQIKADGTYQRLVSLYMQ